MISINLMLGMNRPIFIVPTPITEESVNNQILMEGAELAESGGQILEEMNCN